VLLGGAWGAAPPKPEPAALQQYASAVALHNRGEYALAAEEWAAFIKQHPDHPRSAHAKHYLGFCYLKLGKNEPAITVLQQVIKDHPQFDLLDATYLYLGAAQYQSGQSGKAEAHDAAVQTFDTLLKLYPKSKHVADALFFRGEALYARGHKKEAAQSYAQLIAQHPADRRVREALYALGAVRAELGEYAAAAKSYEQLLEKPPKDEDTTTARLEGGKCYYLSDKYAESRRLLAPLLDAESKVAAEAAHWTARCLLKERQPLEALRLLEKILPQSAKGPWEPQLLLDQADATYEIPERRQEAAALYAALATRHSQSPLAPEARYMAAYVSWGEKDYESALKNAQAFLAAHPKHALTPDVTQIAAEVQLALGKAAEAEKLFATLLQQYPDHTECENWKVRRALSLFLQKKHKEAASALEQLTAQVRNPERLTEVWFLLGRSQTELGDFVASVKSFEAALTARPKTRPGDDILLALALAQLQLKSTEEAKATLRKLVNSFPKSRLLDQAHYRLAELAAAAGDWRTAASEYQKALSHSPDGPLAPLAQYGLGWAELQQKSPGRAEKALDAFVSRFSQHTLMPRARYARALARHQLNKFAEALEDVQASLAAADLTAEEKAEARYLLGLCQAALKRHEEAVRTFQALLREAPRLAIAERVYYELGWALHALGRDKEAAEAFARVAELAPDGPLAAESLHFAAEEDYRQGNFQRAANRYELVIQKAGQGELGEKAAHKLGWTLFRQGDFAAAQKTFRHQRTAWPKGPYAGDATFMEAECFFRLRQYQEADALYAQLPALSTPEFQVLALLHGAQAAAQLKKWERSIALIEQLLTKFPDADCLPEALYELGWAKQNTDKLAEAKALYERVLGSDSGELAARAQVMMGEIQLAEKDYKTAVRSFFRVAYGYGFPVWQVNALYEAARCFELLEKPEQAVKLYEEIVAKHPQSEKAELAKQRLAALAQFRGSGKPPDDSTTPKRPKKKASNASNIGKQ
jgi:TolA-binding protein